MAAYGEIIELVRLWLREEKPETFTNKQLSEALGIDIIRVRNCVSNMANRTLELKRVSGGNRHHPSVYKIAELRGERRPVRRKKSITMEQPLDYSDLGKAVMAIIKDQAKKIDELKSVNKRLVTDHNDVVELNKEFQQLLGEKDNKIVELNKKLTDNAAGKGVSLHDLHKLREGLQS
jgi:hypothetical protein